MRQGSAGTTCVVCGEPLPPHRRRNPGEDTACGRLDCERILRQAMLLPPAQIPGFLRRRAADLHREREQERERLALLARLRERERAQDRAIVAGLARAEDPPPADAQVVPLPSGPIAEVDLEDQRAARYEDRLRDLIQAAVARRQQPDDAADRRVRRHQLTTQEQVFDQRPGLRARCDALCTCCRGGCCSRGADHAFLTVEILAEQLRAEPELDAVGLLERYRSRLPARSVHGGCIHQTASGCSLPRELRADTCNSFYCGPLRAYLESDAGIERRAVLAIQRDHGPWNHLDSAAGHAVIAITLIDDEGSRPLPLPVLEDPAQPDASPAPSPPG